MSNNHGDVLTAVLAEFNSSGAVRPLDVELGADELADWVQMARDPMRFTSEMFDGAWSMPDRHPAAGSVRVIKALLDNDRNVRIVGRQGRRLYVWTHFASSSTEVSEC